MRYTRKVILKLLLSISSFSGVLYFYVVTRQDMPIVSVNFLNLNSATSFPIRNLFYIAVFGAFAYATLFLSKYISASTESLEVEEEKPLESVAVPTYIGLFVIAVGLNGLDQRVSWLILLGLFLFWTRIEKIFYFNPIWLFFGYRFYEVKSINNNTYTLVTKRDRLKGKQSLDRLIRLNNYTFLERGKYDIRQTETRAEKTASA